MGLPIWKLTALEGVPDVPALTADKVTGEAGQYRKDNVPGHGDFANDESSKKRTLEPVSIMPVVVVGVGVNCVLIWPDNG